MSHVDASKDILVCAIEADLDDISLLHGVLAGAGLRARVIVVDAPGARHESHVQIVRKAGVCLIAWSGAGAQSPHLLDLAREAKALKILLPLQIDHAPHPMTDEASIDIAHWREAPDASTRDLLLGRICDIAGPASTQRAHFAETDGVEHRLPRAGFIALALLALIALPVAMAIYEARVRAASIPTSAAYTDARWRLVNPGDIAQLREAIALDPKSAETDRAREQLARIETIIWADVENAATLETRQRALETYLRAFPDGRFTARASEDFNAREAQAR